MKSKSKHSENLGFSDSNLQNNPTKVILANNLAAIGIHLSLSMLLYLATVITFPALATIWPLYVAIYIWCGYKFLQPTNRPHFLSVIALLLLMIFTSAIFVMLTLSRGDEMIFLHLLFNVWSLIMATATHALYTLTQGNFYTEGAYLEAPQLMQNISMLTSAFMPSLMLMVGMMLRSHKLKRFATKN